MVNAHQIDQVPSLDGSDDRMGSSQAVQLGGAGQAQSGKPNNDEMMPQLFQDMPAFGSSQFMYGPPGDRGHKGNTDLQLGASLKEG